MKRFRLGDAWGLGRRTSLGVVDQVVSSVTNFALNILVVSSVPTDAYGAFALVYALYFIFRGSIQALVAQPLLIRHTDQLSGVASEGQGLRRTHELALGGALQISLLGSLILVAGATAVPDELAMSLLALALVLPGLLLQEVMRAVFLAQGRPGAAIAIDSAWAVAQLVLVGLLLSSGTAQVPWLVVAWGVSGGVSAVGAMALDSLWLRLRGAARWLVELRHLSLPFLGEIMTDLLAAQGVMIVLAAVAGLDEVGVFRSAQILFSPLSVLFMAGMTVGIPEAVRVLARAPRRFRSAVVIAGGSVTLAASVWCLIVIGLPDALGARFLGESWAGASSVLPQFSLYYLAAAAGLGALVGLRALAASRVSFAARAVGSVSGFLLGSIGASRAGAAGAAVGLGVGMVTATALLWIGFRARSAEQRDPLVVFEPDPPSPKLDP